MQLCCKGARQSHTPHMLPSLPTCTCNCAGAFVNRKAATPSSADELWEPLPGSKGALPYTMGYTHRMK